MKEVKRLLENLNLKYEEKHIPVRQTYIKKASLNTGEKLTPITYGSLNFNGEDAFYIKDLTPEKLSYFKSLKKPKFIITSSKLKAFYSTVPVFFSKTKIKDGNIKIFYKEKHQEKIYQIVSTYIGYGAKFINVFVPVKDKNLSIAKQIINKLQTISYPRGFRVRFIFLQEDEFFLIEKVYRELFPDSKFNILIDKTGFGFESLVYKINGNLLLNSFLIKTIKKYTEHTKAINLNLYEELNIPDLIWYKSTEENIYNNNEEYIVRRVFSSINFLAKEMI